MTIDNATRSLVSASPVQKHIDALLKQGITLTNIIHGAQVSSTWLQKVYFGRDGARAIRIEAAAAARVLAYRPTAHARERSETA